MTEFRNIQEKYRYIETARDELKTFLVGSSYAIKSKITMDVQSCIKLEDETMRAKKKIIEVLETTTIDKFTKDLQEKELLDSLLLTDQFVKGAEIAIKEIKQKFNEIQTQLDKINDLSSRAPNLRNLRQN